MEKVGFAGREIKKIKVLLYTYDDPSQEELVDDYEVGISGVVCIEHLTSYIPNMCIRITFKNYAITYIHNPHKVFINY